MFLFSLKSYETNAVDFFYCPSVCPHGKIQPPLDGFSRNLVFENFSKICRENLKFHYHVTRITDNSDADQFTLLVISRSVIVRMRNVSHTKKTVGKIKTHILCSITFFFENRAVL